MFMKQTSQISTEYERNVFINCPFDKGYQPLFESMIFTVYACKFIPRCAREDDDSGDIRIKKLLASSVNASMEYMIYRALRAILVCHDSICHSNWEFLWDVMNLEISLIV
jgi:hypothetical protein